MFLCAPAPFPMKHQTALARSVDEWAAASAVAEDGKPRFCGHDWKSSRFPWPFWAVRRLVSDAGTNCKLARVTVNTVRTGSDKFIIPEAVVDAYDVSLPVLINTVDINRCDELVAHWPSIGTAPKKKQGPKYTVQTWANPASKKQNTS